MKNLLQIDLSARHPGILPLANKKGSVGSFLTLSRIEGGDGGGKFRGYLGPREKGPISRVGPVVGVNPTHQLSVAEVYGPNPQNATGDVASVRLKRIAQIEKPQRAMGVSSGLFVACRIGNSRVSLAKRLRNRKLHA